MKRDVLDKLVKWKTTPNRKPLILNGARQVGKTWLMKEFGRLFFKNVAYINFDRNPRMSETFAQDFDVARLLMALQIESRQTIEQEKTLVVFDEIQMNPDALTSLKYFCEEMPQVAIVAAGSLLGIGLHEGTGFPVGKVDRLDVHPMSFTEFLCAVGEESLVKLLEQRDRSLVTSFKTRFIQWLKTYYFVGGMPEAVAAFCGEKSFESARRVQNRILLDYADDFSKHIPPEDLPYAQMLWRSLPKQLAKEKKRFVYSDVKPGLRGRRIEGAMQWLTQAGLVYPVRCVTKPNILLASYEDERFKLFGLDVGLLGAQCELDARTLLEGSRIFTEFKGALTEQYVQQELRAACGIKPFYWHSERANAEVDFIFKSGMDILPLEVKAEENLRAKSLGVYRDTFSPRLCLRASMSDYHRESWLLNLPLYAISQIQSIEDFAEADPNGAVGG